MPFRTLTRRIALFSAASCAAVLTAAVLTAAGPAASASAATLPVNYDFLAGALLTFNSPTTPPPGANNFSCPPSAAHPYPVDPGARDAGQHE